MSNYFYTWRADYRKFSGAKSPGAQTTMVNMVDYGALYNASMYDLSTEH